MQARIQEFSSGGSNLPKNFDKPKKKKKKKKKTTKREKGIGGFSIYCFSMVEIYFAIETAL